MAFWEYIRTPFVFIWLMFITRKHFPLCWIQDAYIELAMNTAYPWCKWPCGYTTSASPDVTHYRLMDVWVVPLNNDAMFANYRTHLLNLAINDSIKGRVQPCKLWPIHWTNFQLLFSNTSLKYSNTCVKAGASTRSPSWHTRLIS